MVPGRRYPRVMPGAFPWARGRFRRRRLGEPDPAGPPPRARGLAPGEADFTPRPRQDWGREAEAKPHPRWGEGVSALPTHLFKKWWELKKWEGSSRVMSPLDDLWLNTPSTRRAEELPLFMQFQKDSIRRPCLPHPDCD